MKDPELKIDWLNFIGIFLLLLGAKLWLICSFGHSTLYWDEWDSLAVLQDSGVLQWHNWLHLFAPHSEHRIFFTRLLGIVVFHLNGLWDPSLLMVLQALIHSLVLCLFLYLACIGLRPFQRPFLLCFGVTLMALPFGWENILWGFQSQFSFQTAFALLCFWLYWKHKTFSPLWWIAVLCSFLGLFTMAGGLFAPVTCLLFCFLRIIESGGQRRECIALGIMAVIVAAGAALVHPVPAHDFLKATSFWSFLIAFLKISSWPFRLEWMAWLTLLPPLVLASQVCRKKCSSQDPRWLLLAVMFWLLLQTSAIAYARNIAVFPSRYYDTYVLILCCCFTCLLLIRQPRSLAAQRKLRAAGLAWLLIVMTGLVIAAESITKPEILEKERQGRNYDKHVSAYLATGNVVHLSGEPVLEIPYPKRERLMKLLDTPSYSALLPTEIRRPLQPVEIYRSETGFVTGGVNLPADDRIPERTTSSYGSKETKGEGKLLLNFSGKRQTPLLQFYVSGYPQEKGMSFFLTDSRGTRHDLASSNPGERWRSFYLRIPDGPFSIEAVDANPDFWLAFTLPKERGELSSAAAYLARRGWWLIILGLIVLALPQIIPELHRLQTRRRNT